MQRFDEKAFGHFRKLRDCVNTSFEKMREETEKKLRHPATSIRWHFYLVALIVLLSWFFGPGSFIVTPIKELIRANSVSVDGMFFFFLLLFGFAGWVIVVALLSRPFFRYTTSGSDAAGAEVSTDNTAGAPVSRCTTSVPGAAAASSADGAAHTPVRRWIKSVFLLFYSVVILPALPFLLILGPSLAVGANTTSILFSYVLVAVVSLVAWLLMFGLMTMVGGSVPHLLFMLLSSVSREKNDAIIPGYINMVQGAARQVVEKEEFNNLTADDWQRIEAIVRWKFDGANGRLQAFSLGVGALGLLGILALLFSQEEIRSSLRRFGYGLMTILGMEIPEFDVSAVFTVVVVGIVFLLAARYFARSYIELRVLEAMGIICSLAASGCADQQRSAPTGESAPLPAPAPPDAVPSPDATATVMPVASRNASDVAQSAGDSSSTAAAPMPSVAPGSEAPGDAAPSASTAGASVHSSGELLNATASSDGQALALAEGSPPCAVPTNGTPDAAQLPGDSSSDVADTPASSDVLGDPPAHADHRF